MSDHAFKTTEHKARKEHKCFWCGEGIEIGETYSQWKTFSDDNWFTTRMHSECLNGAIKLNNEIQVLDLGNWEPYNEKRFKTI